MSNTKQVEETWGLSNRQLRFDSYSYSLQFSETHIHSQTLYLGKL